MNGGPRLGFYRLLGVLPLFAWPMWCGCLEFTSGCDSTEIPLHITETLLHRPKLLLKMTFRALNAMEILPNYL